MALMPTKLPEAKTPFRPSQATRFAVTIDDHYDRLGPSGIAKAGQFAGGLGTLSAPSGLDWRRDPQEPEGCMENSSFVEVAQSSEERYRLLVEAITDYAIF